MPLIHRSSPSRLSLAVWKITEPDSELREGLSLNEEDQVKLCAIANPRRRAEFLVVRKLLIELTANPKLAIIYDENGKPHFPNDERCISISHSRDYVAVVIGGTKAVGVDIEKMEERIYRIADKFLGDDERDFLGGNPPAEKLYLVWSAKETLFKIHSKGGLDFREHLFVKKFDLNLSGKLNASIRRGPLKKEFSLNYLLKDDWLVVWGEEE